MDLSQVIESHQRRLRAVIEEFNPDELLATPPDDLTE